MDGLCGRRASVGVRLWACVEASLLATGLLSAQSCLFCFSLLVSVPALCDESGQRGSSSLGEHGVALRKPQHILQHSPIGAGELMKANFEKMIEEW